MNAPTSEHDAPTKINLSKRPILFDRLSWVVVV